MSLLRDIQNDLAMTGTDITTVLRKAKILGARLKNEAFDQWVTRELNGYSDKEPLPSYRILAINAKAYLIFGWQHLKSAPVMASMIPERFRDWATTAYLRDPISRYAALVDRTNVDAEL
jgi:hypothetical protein